MGSPLSLIVTLPAAPSRILCPALRLAAAQVGAQLGGEPFLAGIGPGIDLCSICLCRIGLGGVWRLLDHVPMR